jgi:hypothetical protein
VLATQPITVIALISMKKAGWALAALVIANEIRGIIVVVTVGLPMLEALW